MKRAPAAVLLAGLLAACGGAPASPLAIHIEPSAAAGGVATWDVRIFGSAVSCVDALGRPNDFLVGTQCPAGQADSRTDCYLLHGQIAPGKTSRFSAVPVGQRRVFLVGLDGAGTKLAKGCGTANVTEGHAASVSVSSIAY